MNGNLVMKKPTRGRRRVRGIMQEDVPLLQTGTRGAAADHELVCLVPPFIHEHLVACGWLRCRQRQTRNISQNVTELQRGMSLTSRSLGSR